MTATFAGAGRDRLCLDERGGRAGFVVYGQGNANCTVSGSVRRSGEQMTLIPEGDESCRIEATISGQRITLGSLDKACAFYCGPSATYGGKTFARAVSPQPATDLAGDPLC